MWAARAAGAAARTDPAKSGPKIICAPSAIALVAAAAAPPLYEATGTFSFSNELAGKIIILEYISDGLAADEDTRVPKMAEQAMYMHIVHAILSGRANIPEYVIQRFKKERSSALRNAKIRLSDIKLEEFTQVMRGKSKWIKH